MARITLRLLRVALSDSLVRISDNNEAILLLQLYRQYTDLYTGVDKLGLADESSGMLIRDVGIVSVSRGFTKLLYILLPITRLHD